MGYLYRGVSVVLDQQNEGKLRPKGNQSEIAIRVGDPGIKVDGTWRVGKCEENTVRAHHLEITHYNGCFVSTTSCESMARKFATYYGLVEGYVYVIDEAKLTEQGVIAIERVYAENDHEQEVSLRAKDCGDLPEAIIVGKYPVRLGS